jgi:hypothetical protein
VLTELTAPGVCFSQASLITSSLNQAVELVWIVAGGHPVLILSCRYKRLENSWFKSLFRDNFLNALTMFGEMPVRI